MGNDLEAPRRLPAWLKVRAPGSEGYLRVKGLLRRASLHTVCEEAACPNIGECFGAGTATFLILGDVCTRACRFCAITSGRPGSVDAEEPRHVAETVATLGLRHAVVTSVTRDDVPDGGASVFAATIREIRRLSPGTAVEVLIPDLRGDWQALSLIIEAAPDILNHNLETVSRLYRTVRPQAIYARSLDLLQQTKAQRPDMLTKSGLMLGLGEEPSEVGQAMSDLREAGCDILTLGQYLQPSRKHLPVARFYAPEEFEELAKEGHALGFRHVEAGPLVRSSYRAAQQSEGQRTPRAGE
jgi:lipoic acid synthetase